ncbi:hypothetical protein N7450_005013 [Penicillium hetheringtonii]|uniref:Calponin-homology (CH) domain-containing protein n=1 Tax=Penicillium hetheringtonii TaxID=911720 RepID=A0AAD6DR91_9EURO|nr:hypothetical protein N7450_005013 [Penicillium hetheringtonii]
MDSFDRGKNAGTTYESIRRSLRPLQQVPQNSPSIVNNKALPYRHSRSNTLDESHHLKDYRPSTPESHQVYQKENESPRYRTAALEPQTPPPAPSPRHWPPTPTAGSPRPSSPQKTLSNSPHPPTLTTALSAPDIETFQKSSTRHLRTLSKFAQSGETDDFQFGSGSASVVGLQGRRRLKRADSVAGRSGAISPEKPKTSSWAAGNWMDAQRQFLQAYEYLCHIGEAKEWIEEVIQKQIPPIVQLEEGLRDGVTLAELVQAMYPDTPMRIFRNPKLQYRHSDNIALFFRFLDDIELPELFRFELIDLYEKKNIPKVIHCIHALSWLLFKNGMLDFRMGNLVGQLEFEHHELEKTQKGLDKAGVSMPSFAGMAANFGAEPEPEPEPVESEEERIDRELHENEGAIVDFQAQIQGAMVRLKLGNVMNDLWDFEPRLIELQSRLRGDWARQISQYRLDMRRFAIQLQAVSRGFIVRQRQQGESQWRKSQEKNVLQLQNLIRASKVRAETNMLQTRIHREESGIKHFQAAIRAALQRKALADQYEQSHHAENEVTSLQAAIRGAMQRKRISTQSKEVKKAATSAKSLQAVIRGELARQQLSQTRASLQRETAQITQLQAAVRALKARNSHSGLLQALSRTAGGCAGLQALIRGAALRKSNNALRAELSQHATSTTDLQALLRGNFLRQFLHDQQAALLKEDRVILELQSRVRAMMERRRLMADRRALKCQENIIVNLQALSRAALLRIEVGDILTRLEETKNK